MRLGIPGPPGAFAPCQFEDTGVDFEPPVLMLIL